MKRVLAILALVLALPLAAHAAGLADYTAALSGPETVAPGGTFTRTLVVSNDGDGGGVWPVTATVNQIAHATFVSVSGPAFQRCAAYKFSSGALNYVRCFNAYLLPGQSAEMVVTYRAPVSGWLGWVYTGGGYVAKTPMELESDKTNNYSYGVNTVVSNG